ncbi:hypothetical protein AB0B95_10570 [Streptomyces hygroscopicus]|uniref:hypothetical protein n=1 Tax=Streptomyces hygroscopicus TaxID=1912 RepID=UPI0007675D12|nr:hypothetical protein [Streptomyces hygroscopicus]
MALDWAAVAVGGITAVAGISGSLILAWTTRRTAEQRVKADLMQGEFTRFAVFQMHKRAVYSDLLKAGQDTSQGSADGVPSEWSKERARALVVAQKPLRVKLMELTDAELPLRDEQLTDLVVAMREDVDTQLVP